MKQRTLVLGFLSVAFVADAGPALAYIDPGIASVLLQGVVGGAATALVVLRLYGAKAKRKLLSLFRGGRSDPREDASTAE